MMASLLGGLIALIGAGVWLLRVRRYARVFRIPARRNDVCTCRGSHQSVPVTVRPRGFDLPAGSFGRGQTAFLAIDVAATVAGALLDPFIEIGCGGVSYRQYFERGVAGNRYLNLSLAFGQIGAGAPRSISLRGGHVRWKAGASLLVFDPPAIREGVALVAAPHPDDSEIAAFGLYSSLPSWVVTVTCGERSPTDLSCVTSSAEERVRWLARLRVWDSLQIPQLGGVSRERCLNLVFPDTLLKQMCSNPEQVVTIGCEDRLSRRALRSQNTLPQLQNATAGCTWRDLVQELRWLLDTSCPTILVCPHPLVDPSPDHVFTSVALAEALGGASHQPDLVLLYVVHANEAPVYPFGSAATAVSLPPWENREWIADSIYSHPLSEETRCAKFFAVEAAHDLRTYSHSGPRTIRQLAKQLRREVTAFVSGLGVHPTDFRRRAPRPNELYYVVSADGLHELAQRALSVARLGRAQ